MQVTIPVEELQNEIGRLHVQVMAYERERVRLTELVKSLTPVKVETPEPTPASKE